jgi:hypothetical protein
MSNESKVVAQHTPGPWELMEHGAYGDFDGRSQIIMSEPLSGDNPFRLAAVHVDNMDDVAGAANARLMAASPKLLAALMAFVERGTCFDDEDMRNARAAISLATGEGAAMKEQKT